MDVLDSVLQGLATAIPIIVTSLVVMYKFKNELCSQISDLKVKVESHIEISEFHISEMNKIKEQLTNIILRNKLKT